MKQISIGRSPENTIAIPFATVSNFHAIIELDNGNRLIIRDLNSTNGTYLNGSRITTSELKKGDILKVDEHLVSWENYIDNRYGNQRGSVTLGRDYSCDLCLNYPDVSSFHVKLTDKGNHQILVEDLNSTNGTYINDKRVQKGTLNPGDTLCLANKYPVHWEKLFDKGHVPPLPGVGGAQSGDKVPVSFVKTKIEKDKGVAYLAGVGMILFFGAIIVYMMPRESPFGSTTEPPKATIPDTAQAAPEDNLGEVAVYENESEPVPPKNLSQIVEEVEESVVLILVFDRNNEIIGTGSGFFVKENYTLTNYHVLRIHEEDIGSIVIKTLSGAHEQIPISYLKRHAIYDKRSDWLMFRTDKIHRPGIPMSRKRPRKGEDIIVIGNPVAEGGILLEGSVTRGIISNVRSREPSIQIDAAVTSGNSGGPLINMEGEAIGITTAKIGGCENCNLAVDIRKVQRKIEKEIEGKR